MAIGNKENPMHSKKSVPKGYRVISGFDKYKHRFGGNDWSLPVCERCGEPLHQIFTFDLSDPQINTLSIPGLVELPLVSCLNCSKIWDTQVFKLNQYNNTISIMIQKDTENWKQEDEDKLPNPLPVSEMTLTDMIPDDNPINDTYKAFDLFGTEYVCRLLGQPLYIDGPINTACPICQKEMIHVATITEESYDERYKCIKHVDFHFGEMYLYFLLCKDCLVLKTECQG